MYHIEIGEILFLLRHDLYKALERSKNDAKIDKTVPGLVSAIALFIHEADKRTGREELQNEIMYQVMKVWDALREGSAEPVEMILMTNLKDQVLLDLMFP